MKQRSISLDKQENLPGFGRSLVFRGKATLLQLNRAGREAINGEVTRSSVGTELTARNIIAESRTPLWTESESQETPLLAGKIHNLRLAIRKLNGVEVPVIASTSCGLENLGGVIHVRAGEIDSLRAAIERVI